MKKNDIYHWAYKDTKESFEPYWCCSCIAIFDGNILIDTYWQGTESRNWSESDAEKRLNLEYIANLDELKKVAEDHKMYYQEKDIIDLTHANSHGKQIYVRIGAKRNLKRMEEILERQIERSESEIKSANNQLERSKQILNGLTEENKDNEYIPWRNNVSLDY